MISKISHTFFALVLLFLCGAVSLRAEMKIGTVDMNRIFTEYTKTNEAKTKYTASGEAIEKDLNDRAADLKKKMDEINQLTAAIEKSDLSKKELDVKKKECEEKIEKARTLDRELVEYRSAKQKKLQDEFLGMRQEIINDIMKVINDQTKTRGFDMVLDKSGLSAGAVPVVLFARPDLDISDSVLAVLNKKAK